MQATKQLPSLLPNMSIEEVLSLGFMASSAPTSPTRLVRLLLPIFSSAVPQALDGQAPDRCLAHLNPTDPKEKLASLPVGGPRTTLDVLLKYPYGALIQLRIGARSLLGGKKVVLIEPLKVAPDRRMVNSEPTGGLALGDTSSYRLYYLGAQVYGIGFHLPMNAYCCNITASRCSVTPADFRTRAPYVA